MLNPFTLKVLGSFARRLLDLLSGVLVAREWMTESQAYSLVESLMPLVLALIPVLFSQAWSIFEKHKTTQEQLTGQAMPAGTTTTQVKEEVKKGHAPPVTLPADVRPRMPGTEDLTGVTYPSKGTLDGRGK